MIVAVWDGIGFLDGWTPLHNVRTVVEPSRGNELGRTGMADAADIKPAAPPYPM